MHISRGNFVGADRLLRTSLDYLAAYRGTGALGFDVEALCVAAEACHERIRTLGVHEFDLSAAPTWAFDEAALADDARRRRAWGFASDGSAQEMTITVVE